MTCVSLILNFTIQTTALIFNAVPNVFKVKVPHLKKIKNKELEKTTHILFQVVDSI